MFRGCVGGGMMLRREAKRHRLLSDLSWASAGLELFKASKEINHRLGNILTPRIT